MLDHFRADHTIESGVHERQREDRAVDERVAIAARIAQLVQLDVQTQHARHRAQDPARPATDIQDAGKARR